MDNTSQVLAPSTDYGYSIEASLQQINQQGARKMVASSITQEQAREIAKKMHAQRISAPKICKHLEEIGYRGERTGQPIKINMVYSLLSGDKRSPKAQAKEHQAKAKVEQAVEKREATREIHLTQSLDAKLVQGLKKLLDIEEIPASLRLQVLADQLSKAKIKGFKAD